MRTITLSNIGQTLFAKASDATLGKAAGAAVHPTQQGFTPVRGMVSNNYEALAPTHISRCLADVVPAVVLFDIRAAFPSMSWEWFCLVLGRFVAPDWLVVALHSYVGSHSDAVFAGVLSR